MWRAYLSTQAMGGGTAANAKDRIGRGPWQNAKGTVIAKDVADLHGPNNNLTKQTALSEKGEMVKGRGDQPNQHDILTGSQPDGTAFAGNQDMTCGNWTKSGTEGAAMTRPPRPHGHRRLRAGRNPGTHRMRLAAAAARTPCAAPAARACSIASPPINRAAKSTAGIGSPRRRQAASSVLRRRQAMVIGPTPPGTGVMAQATSAASA